MRNLKRALSLALAAIMLLGMMVVGAGAVNLDEFSDKEDIVNKDAVSLLTTLGIINGKEDGSFFDPNGNVTRAEMAKMISVILNKGADNNDLYTGAASSLTDVKGHWAEGHINYCSSLGIIAGRGDGTFDPGATVTASEAAKMLLVAVGYNAEIERFVGGDWAVNVNAKASALGIFNGFTKNVTAPLNRDDAALLIYNALDVERIQQYSGNYALVYSDRRTILGEVYGVYKLKAVVTGNKWAQLDGTEYDERLADGKTRVDNPRVYTSNTLGTNTGDSSGNANNNNTIIDLGNTRIFDVDTPVEYLGQTVTMYVRKTTVLNDYEVLGVQLREEDNTVVKTAEIIDVNPSDNVLKTLLKGTGLTIKTDKDNAPEYYVNYGKVADRDAANAELKLNPAKNVVGGDTIIDNKYGVELTIIDNDKDGNVDYVLWLQEDLTQLTAKNTNKDYVTFLADPYKPDLTGYNRARTIDTDDVVFVDEAKEGDLVLVRTYGGRYYVSQPEVITGKMESYSAKKTAEQYIVVDGETYHASFINTTAGGQVDQVYTFDVADCANKEDDGVQWDITYDFYLDSNGHIAAFKPSEKLVPNYALILESGYNPGVYASDASGKVTVLLSDGTEATYALNFSASASNLGKQLDAFNGNSGKHDYHEEKNDRTAELKGFLGTDYTDNSDTRPWNDTAGIYTGFTFAGKDTAGGIVTVTDPASGFISKADGSLGPKDYKAGKAAGYVITYTLNSDDVLTIQSVVGSFLSYEVQNATTGTAVPGATLGSFVSGAVKTEYKSGNAVVKHADDENGLDKTETAVDLDTVAFYYVDADNYGVAIGYNDMSDAAVGTKFLGTNMGAKYTDGAYRDGTGTNLAEMLLFNCKGKEATKNFVYILERNDHNESGKYVSLYGILEDGKAVTLKVERDNWEEVELDDTDGKYNNVFEYSTNSAGVTKLSDPANTQVLPGYALRLTNGTVAFKPYVNGLPADLPLPTQKNYTTSYALAKADHVWDVTNAEEEVDAPAGAFSTATVKHAIIILDKKTGGTKINAAYVWDIDPDDLIAGLNIPVITANKDSVLVGEGVTLTATNVGGGTAPYTYEWKMGNTVLTGKTGSSITLTGDELGAAGDKNFTVTVKDADGKTKTSAVKKVTVGDAADGLTLTIDFSASAVRVNGASVSTFGSSYVDLKQGDKVQIVGTELKTGTIWKVADDAATPNVQYVEVKGGMLTFTMPAGNVSIDKDTDQRVKFMAAGDVDVSTLVTFGKVTAEPVAAEKAVYAAIGATTLTVKSATVGTGFVASASADVTHAATSATFDASTAKAIASGNDLTTTPNGPGVIYLLPAATVTISGETKTVEDADDATAGANITTGEYVVVGTNLTIKSKMDADTTTLSGGEKVKYETATTTPAKVVDGSTEYTAANAGATPPVAEAAATANYEMTNEDVTFTVAAP